MCFDMVKPLLKKLQDLDHNFDSDDKSFLVAKRLMSDVVEMDKEQDSNEKRQSFEDAIDPFTDYDLRDPDDDELDAALAFSEGQDSLLG